MREETVRALFVLAGIKVFQVYKIENQYWPDAPEYADIRKSCPWWLVMTSGGIIKIGWRKRVIEIDWGDTSIRGIVTGHDVTKSDSMVHAYSYSDAVAYLTKLRQVDQKNPLEHESQVY